MAITSLPEWVACRAISPWPKHWGPGLGKMVLVDRGIDVRRAVDAPRVHLEGGVLYVEPGIDLGELGSEERDVVRFGALNLFFGGVQAVQREGHRLTGAGDPRRGGVAVRA